MAVLTLLTLVFEFLSPLIVTVVYLIFFSIRSNKFIEALGTMDCWHCRPSEETEAQQGAGS